MTRVLSVSVLFAATGSSVIEATVAEFVIVRGPPCTLAAITTCWFPTMAGMSPSLQVTVAPETEHDPRLVFTETICN